MDLTELIEQHREALKGILAALVAMVEFGAGRSGGAATLPRHLHRAVLSLLRPAESAARRLAIVLARGLAQPKSRTRTAPPKARASLFVREGAGTGIVRRPGVPVPPAFAHLVPRKAASPRFSFPLLDPLPRVSRRGLRQQPGAALPRIGMAGMAALPALPEWRPPLPDDPIDAGRLGRRLDALSRVLDDLPGLARRFARWQARRDFALAEGRAHRVSPLRGGPPPGGRLARYDPEARRRRRIREVDEILAHAHALAHHALQRRPDTS